MDYQKWLKKEAWSELEARYLLSGLIPVYDWKHDFLPDNFLAYTDESEGEAIQQRFKTTVSELVNAIRARSIEPVEYTGDPVYQSKGWKATANDVSRVTRYYLKTDLLKWAIAEGLEIPKELFDWYIAWQAGLIPENRQPINTQSQPATIPESTTTDSQQLNMDKQKLIDSLRNEFNSENPTLEQIAPRLGIKTIYEANRKFKNCPFVFKLIESNKAPYLVNLPLFVQYCLENNIKI